MLIERNPDKIIYKIDNIDLLQNNLSINAFINREVSMVNFINNLIKKEGIVNRLNEIFCDVKEEEDYPIIISFSLNKLIAPIDIKTLDINEDRARKNIEKINEILKDRRKKKEGLKKIKAYEIHNFNYLAKVIERTNIKKNICIYKIKDTYYLDLQNNIIDNIDNIFYEYDINYKYYDIAFLEEHNSKKQVISIEDFKKVMLL